jgi:hypothetical protein
MSVHVPPFLQGLVLHSFISENYNYIKIYPRKGIMMTQDFSSDCSHLVLDHVTKFILKRRSVEKVTTYTLLF